VKVLPSLVAGQAGTGLGPGGVRDRQVAAEAALARPGQEWAQRPGGVEAVADEPAVEVVLGEGVELVAAFLDPVEERGRGPDLGADGMGLPVGWFDGGAAAGPAQGVPLGVAADHPGMPGGFGSDELAGPGRDAVEVFEPFRQSPGDHQPIPQDVQGRGGWHLIEQGVADRLLAGREAGQELPAARCAQPPQSSARPVPRRQRLG